MKIIEYRHEPANYVWLEQIRNCDWRAGPYLYQLIRDNRFRQVYGETSRVLLLTEGNRLISFCTYAEQDDIPMTDLTPWIGYVYTFPAERGRRRVGKLFEYAYKLAKEEGHHWIYICTHDEGIYEKYGCIYWKDATDREGVLSRIYRLPVVDMDYSGIIGRPAAGTVDRPLGTSHPNHKEMIYPVNYGYIDGVMGGDGEEQDAYILGTDLPLKTFSGKVIGVYHRLNDCEDKWIVSVDGQPFSRDTILNAIAFQEQYYMGELYT